jgi:hypothetical protein
MYETPKVIQHDPWYTDNDPSRRPFASRHETTITLQPSKASFTIPQSWVEWHQRSGNNLHLTHAQLDAVARGEGEWDTEFASVCNAVFPFDRCCAHVGGEGWGRKSVSYTDLQVRVYELEESLRDVEIRINKDGVADVNRFSGHDPDLKQDLEAKWRQTVLSYVRFYYDYGATAHVDFRVRQFDRQTFVFVFMYTNSNEHEKTITSILESFEVP